MSSITRQRVIALKAALLGALFGLVVASPGTWAQTVASSAPPARERARIVQSEALPKLDGDHLKVTLVEVNYGPGEKSAPHSHACAVLGYVVAGELRTQVQGEPMRVYKSGQSFYEAPNGVHLVSANASSTRPAKFVAYLICDHDTPLSQDAPSAGRGEGAGK